MAGNLAFAALVILIGIAASFGGIRHGGDASGWTAFFALVIGGPIAILLLVASAIAALLSKLKP